MNNTGKDPNWNYLCSSILSQLLNFFQFRVCDSTIIYVIVNWHVLNWNKLDNWNGIEEHT